MDAAARHRLRRDLHVTQTTSRAVKMDFITRRPEENRADEEFAGKTHFKMGNSWCPLSPAKFSEFCEVARTGAGVAEANRQGLRTVAKHVLPESCLIVPPAGQRLVARNRGSCWKTHPGFCVERDADVSRQYRLIFPRLKDLECEARAGKVLYRFSSDGGHELHMLFASFRDRPRYRATYIECVRCNQGDEDGPEFPYTVVLRQTGAPLVADPFLQGNAVTTLTTHALAVRLARMALPVAMEQMEHRIGETLAHSVIEGTELLIQDLLEPVAPPAPPPVPDEEDPLDYLLARRQPVRRARRACNNPAAAVVGPGLQDPLDILGAQGDDDGQLPPAPPGEWWLSAAPRPPRQRRARGQAAPPPAAAAEPLPLEDQGPGSEADDDGPEGGVSEHEVLDDAAGQVHQADAAEAQLQMLEEELAEEPPGDPAEPGNDAALSVHDLVLGDRNYVYCPRRPVPIGRVTAWRVGQPGASVSALCYTHRNCRRVFSLRQLDQWNLGNGNEELMRWLLAPIADPVGVPSRQHHQGLPKPLHGPNA